MLPVSGMLPGVPWYVHPAEDPHGWRRLPAVMAAGGFIVANVHNGPGHRDDPYYPQVLHRTAHFGYVDMNYGSRPLAAVVQDVRRWLSWYGSEGIMLDRVPSGQGALVRDVVAAVRAAGAPTVVGNPGVAAHPEVLVAFDVVCVAEDVAERYLRMAGPVCQAAELVPTWHLVHGCSPELRRAVVDHAAATGATYLHATSQVLPHPWSGRGWWWPGSTFPARLA